LILLDGDRVLSWSHPATTEHAIEMVDLVGDESGDAPFEDGDAAFACDVLVLDVDHERTGDQTCPFTCVTNAEGSLM